jgi:hypothetical protein
VSGMQTPSSPALLLYALQGAPAGEGGKKIKLKVYPKHLETDTKKKGDASSPLYLISPRTLRLTRFLRFNRLLFYAHSCIRAAPR